MRRTGVVMEAVEETDDELSQRSERRKAASRRGGLASSLVRRLRAEKKWEQMSKREVYNVGYSAGHQAALRLPMKARRK